MNIYLKAMRISFFIFIPVVILLMLMIRPFEKDKSVSLPQYTLEDLERFEKESKKSGEIKYYELNFNGPTRIGMVNGNELRIKEKGVRPLMLVMSKKEMPVIVVGFQLENIEWAGEKHSEINVRFNGDDKQVNSYPAYLTDSGLMTIYPQPEEKYLDFLRRLSESTRIEVSLKEKNGGYHMLDFEYTDGIDVKYFAEFMDFMERRK